MLTSGRKRFKPSQYVPVSTAATLLVGSTTLFLVFTCPWLTMVISPAVPLYNGLVFLFVLANFSMATFMDPGVYPRANEDKDEDFRAPLYKNVEIKGIQIRMKWCTTCHFYRPPRCSHCSVCDNCVEDFDHHCPWVNNCIGRRNYRYFFLFLLTLTIHMMGVFFFGLIFVLYHKESLAALHTSATLVVMCITGIFFIPVMGLTGFHIVLVARGRTTNEQVIGKFQEGINPFTRGCPGNLEYAFCSPLSPRYIVDPSKNLQYEIPSVLTRPNVSDRQITVKVSDNGISSTSKSSLNGFDEKETPPPLPAKVDRYYQLKSLLSSNEECSLSGKTYPSTPTMEKLRPSFVTMPKVNYHPTGEKIVILDDPKNSAIVEERVHGHDYQSEPNLDMHTGSSLKSFFQSSSLQLDSDPVDFRSLSLKRGKRGVEKGQVSTLQSQTVTSNPYRSVFPPNTLSNLNGSLSYDSLINPNISAATAKECLARHGVSKSMGFHSPYLPTKLCHMREPEVHKQQVTLTHSPRAVTKQSPHLTGRDASPVRYDNLSQTIMASIQERKEIEERDKQHKCPHTHSYAQDSGEFELGYGLNPNRCYQEGPCCPRPRGSRDNLMVVGLHTEHSSQTRGLERYYCSHQPHPHPPVVPHSSSYFHQNASYSNDHERIDAPHLVFSREAMMINGQVECDPDVNISPGHHSTIKTMGTREAPHMRYQCEQGGHFCLQNHQY
ncbi:palmitoyltransferase ZDHHC8B isoform X1 [Gouania willdenowi]|uniref:palmitoyltransferase ZDHHC8B isoform X1 n=1 Tax=Gouania willdenowi TaxID=441366 RepID=UPI00105414D8|nr:probable palmitoyltransferase ZDHHC8 isoform X1 [Gouania willdenowi]